MNSSLAALTNKLTKRKPSKVLIHLSLEKGRDNGLLVLTEKFIELIKKREDYTIDLNEAANILKVRKRRIYDITNVLEGINYIEKPQKNTVKWIAGNESPESENEIDEIKQKHEELTE
jgi:transcription factor E2F3